MRNDLTERKLRILEFIIREYIQTAEPIGSRTVSKNKSLNVSAATIRNDMSDLEELGLLLQPHTSAGRIPSEKAYEIYVESMMNQGELREADREFIRAQLSQNIDKIGNLLQRSLDLISSLTDYISVGVLQEVCKKRLIKNISLVPIDNRRVVVVTVLDSGEVLSENLLLPQNLDNNTLHLISQTINETMSGRCYEEVGEDLLRYIKAKISEYSTSLEGIFDFLEQQLLQEQPFHLLFNGMTNIFNHPEFYDIDKAKSFLTMIDEETPIRNLMNEKGIRKGDINIIIGDESMGSIMKDCSIITADYIKDGLTIGKVGIIGPKRMDYQRAYNIMSYLQSEINRLLNDS